MSNLFRFTFTVVCFGLCNLCLAQSFYKERISKDNIFSIGVGPSFAYLDNGGQYRTGDFEIKPSISASLIKRMTPRFDLRATAGIQWIRSGGKYGISVTDKWSKNFSSFTTKGQGIYFDMMPSFNVVPFANHMNRSRWNLYGGAGIGLIHVNTNQTKSFSKNEVPTRAQITTAYIPLRAGLSYRIGPYADIAGEGAMFFTFTDNLDGNMGYNPHGDHLGQAQIVYRRYFIPKARE